MLETPSFIPLWQIHTQKCLPNNKNYLQSFAHVLFELWKTRTYKFCVRLLFVDIPAKNTSQVAQ